jgi:thiamine biosynthesis protein ThiI
MYRISPDISVSGGWDHLFVTAPNNFEREKSIAERLKNTAGIGSFSRVLEFPFIDFEDTLERVKISFGKSLLGKTFCVRVKRSGCHDFCSPDLERFLGGGILQSISGTSVDLHHPQKTVLLHIKGNTMFLFEEKKMAIGGYPLGSQGKVLVLLSGGYDSAVSAYMMMNNGCKVDFLFFNLGGTSHEKGVGEIAEYLWKTFSQSFTVKLFSVPFEHVVRELSEKGNHRFRGVILKRMMLQIADKIAKKNGYKALVTGESLAQVSSQTLQNLHVISQGIYTLIFRPLLAMTKPEIISRAKMIGTAKFSEKVPEYCGIISDKPSASVKMKDIVAEEKKFLGGGEYIETRDITVRMVSEYNTWKNDMPHVEIISSPEKGSIVLDIREDEEQKEMPLHVCGIDVKCIPFHTLLKKFPDLDQTKTYFLYCERGIISKMYAEELSQKGFRNVKVYAEK